MKKKINKKNVIFTIQVVPSRVYQSIKDPGTQCTFKETSGIVKYDTTQ